MRVGVDLLVAGPVTRDLTLSVPEIPPDGGSAIADAIRAAVGGKGGNPAVVAARLGASVRLLGAVGRDPAGDLALDQLQGDGIDVGGVARLEHAVTGQIVHLVEPGGRRRYVERRGANELVAASREQVRRACRAGTIVLLSTALRRDAVENVVDGAHDGGARVWADLAGDPDTAAAVLDRVDVARGDADEVSALVGASVDDFASASEAARRLLARGPSMAIVQAGDEGNVVLTGDRELRVSQAPVTLVDPTGGGDAFIAALMVALGRGDELTAALRLAAGAAGHAVSQLGGRPTFPDEAQLRAIARDCRVDELSPDR